MNSLRSDRAATAFRCRLVQQVPEANVTSKHRTLPEQRKKEKEMPVYENGYSLAPPYFTPHWFRLRRELSVRSISYANVWTPR